jgi:predicted nucleic acid-binding protein
VKVALDTNVLVYALGVNDEKNQFLAIEILDRLPAASRVVPIQAIGELFRVLVKKANLPPAEASDLANRWRNMAMTVDTTEALMMSAIELSAHHRFSIWDSVILAAAASVGCSLLLSEDMHEGFSWSGVTIVNPLKRPIDKRLAEVLV